MLFLKGELSEWLKEPASKTGVRVTVPGVRIPHSPQSGMASQRGCGAFLISGRCKLACIRTDIGKAQEGRRPGMPFDPLQGPLRRGARDVAPRATIPTGFARRDTDEGPVPSVSRQQKPHSRPKTVRDTDDMGHWSVSRQNKEKSGYKPLCFLTDAHSMFLSRKEFVYLVPESLTLSNGISQTPRSREETLQLT